MGRQTELPHIGPELERQFRAAGIDTSDKLHTRGSRDARPVLRARESGACYHRLCAPEGALRGGRRHGPPPEGKQELREFYAARKGEA